MYLVNDNNEQVRIDAANNTFLKGKCINPKVGQPMTIDMQAELLKVGRDDGHLEYGVAVKVTGHISNFTYGHTKDDEGNPICTYVSTGEKDW